MWQSLTAIFPWLDAVAPWFEILKSSWHTIESVLLLGGLWLISRRLKSERLKMGEVVGRVTERVETFGQFAKAAQDAAEAAAANQSYPTNYWDVLRSDWMEIRDRIELAIERIDHKSIRGKYAKIARRSYRDIIVTLGEDGFLKPPAEAALLQLNQKFLALRTRPTATTYADVQDFQRLVRNVNGSLPKLPKTKQSPPLPVAAE